WPPLRRHRPLHRTARYRDPPRRTPRDEGFTTARRCSHPPRRSADRHHERNMTMTYPVLNDKVAIITGAAMGMGAATAQLFAEAGAKVVVADFNEDKGREVVAGIEATGGIAFFQ